MFNYYRPQLLRKGNVFTPVYQSFCSCMARGGIHGRGHAWQGAGVGCVWQRGVHGRGTCVAGVCMAGGMHGRGCVWQGGMHGKGGVHVGRDGYCSLPPGMHSCFSMHLLYLCVHNISCPPIYRETKVLPKIFFFLPFLL